MSKKYRAAIFGCGMIGGLADSPGDRKIITHAHAFKQSDQCTLVACCDTQLDNLESFKKRWGRSIQSFSDYHDLISNEQFEIASVATDTATHAAILKELLALDGVKLIICEKPIVADFEQLREIEEILSEHQEKTVLINFSRRYDPGFGKLAEIVSSGALGRPEYFSGVFTKGLYHNGCHVLELLEWFFGPVAEVTVNANTLFDGDSYGCYYLEMERCAGTLANSRGDEFSIFEMDMLFQHGRIRIAESGHRLQIDRPEESELYEGYRMLSDIHRLEDSLPQSMAHVLQYGCDALEEKKSNARDVLAAHLALSGRLLRLRDRLAAGETKIRFDRT